MAGEDGGRTERDWCAESGSRPLGKLNFFGVLRERGMFTETARVGGVTVRNVCVSWRLKVGV